jgi:energy-coupling factor transport system permease protein
VAVAWCAALAAAALVIDHPLVLGALLATIVAAGLAARVGDQLATSVRLAIPFFVMWVVIEPLVFHGGLTVIARLGDLPLFGRIDVTLEATVAGAIYGLRSFVVIVVFGVYAAAVDPDEILRLFRRSGMRSSLTVTVATRMVGVLERDGRRYADGQRCRGTAKPSRLAVVRAVAGGALERALDVSAALELRGYGVRRPAHRARKPWSRHDVSFAASAVALVALLVIGEASGVTSFSWDPRLSGPPVLQPAAMGLAFAVVALLPFLDRRGIER